MKLGVMRRTGSVAFIELARSINNPQLLFMSCPPVAELTRGQALDLLDALDNLVEEIWPE